MDFHSLDFVRGALFGIIVFFTVIFIIANCCNNGFTQKQQTQLIQIIEQSKEIK